jgi:hypothetical protein
MANTAAIANTRQIQIKLYTLNLPTPSSVCASEAVGSAANVQIASVLYITHIIRHLDPTLLSLSSDTRTQRFAEAYLSKSVAMQKK